MTQQLQKRKTFDHSLSSDTIPKCDRQTDGWTDRIAVTVLLLLHIYRRTTKTL